MKLYAGSGDTKEDHKDLFYGLGSKEAGVPFLFQKIGSQNGMFIIISVYTCESIINISHFIYNQ